SWPPRPYNVSIEFPPAPERPARAMGADVPGLLPLGLRYARGVVCVLGRETAFAQHHEQAGIVGTAKPKGSGMVRLPTVDPGLQPAATHACAGAAFPDAQTIARGKLAPGRGGDIRHATSSASSFHARYSETRW